MTPKERLINEIELASPSMIDELLNFLELAKTRYASQKKQSFAEFIEELVSDIPPEVLATLPPDSAVEHDHYIYGTPKKYTAHSNKDLSE